MRIAILSRYNGLVNRGVMSWSINMCRHLARLGHTCLLIQGGPDVPAGTPYRTVAVPVARRQEFRWVRPGLMANLRGG